MNETRQAITWWPGFRRAARSIYIYLLSTKILVGGILAFGATQAVEAYKIYRTESREDIKAVTDKVSDLVKDLPTDAAGVAKVIKNVENLYITFPSTPAREYISGVVGQLTDIKARYAEQERRTKEADDAARVAAEAKAKSDAATKAAEDAKAAQAAEAARLEVEAKAQADASAAAALRAKRQADAAAAARKQAARDAKAYFDFKRWDRAPK